MASCYAAPAPTFQRAMRIISSITNANPGVVTTTFDHQYESGLIVRFDIPEDFGMQQLEKQTATITVLSDTTFSIDIDTTNFEAFAYPSSYTQCPQIVPVGESNNILTEATQNVLPY